MCYFCIEIHPLNIAIDLAKGEAVNLNDLRTFDNCLEEHPNLQQVLTQETEGFQRLLNTLDDAEKSEIYIYHGTLETIFCRTIQTLTTKGFKSTEYQTLISNPIVIRIIKNEIKRSLPSLNGYLPPSAMVSLLDYQTFTEKSKWEKIINNPSLALDCDKLINAYLN